MHFLHSLISPQPFIREGWGKILKGVFGYGLFKFDIRFGKITLEDGETWIRYLKQTSQLDEIWHVGVSREINNISRKKFEKINKKKSLQYLSNLKISELDFEIHTVYWASLKDCNWWISEFLHQRFKIWSHLKTARMWEKSANFCEISIISRIKNQNTRSGGHGLMKIDI